MEEKEETKTVVETVSEVEAGKEQALPDKLNSYIKFGSDIYTKDSLMLNIGKSTDVESESKDYIVVTAKVGKNKYKKYKTNRYIDINVSSPVKENLNEILGLTGKNAISPKNKLVILGDIQIIFKDSEHKVISTDVIKSLTLIGNVLVHIGDNLKIYINVTTGTLYVESAARDGSENKVTSAALFAHFSTEKHEEKLSTSRLEEVANMAVPNEQGVSPISTMMKLVNPKVTDDSIDSSLNDNKIKNVYGKALIDWLLSNEIVGVFNATAFLKKFVPGYMFDLEISDSEFADGNIDVGMVHFDKNAVIQNFYPEIITSVIKTCDIEKNENGVPVISEDDRKTLEFIGIKKDDAGSIIDMAYSTIDASRTIINENEAKLADSEFGSKCFDAECSLCAISSTPEAFFGGVNKDEFDIVTEKQDIAKLISDTELSLEEQCEGLASLQMLSRYQVKKQMEDGTFRNYHAFSSAMIFFTAMKREGIVKAENGVDNHGAINAFFDYALNKIKFNSTKTESGWSSSFYENRIANSIFGELDDSYVSSLEQFAGNTISLGKYKDLDTKQSIASLIGEVTHKDNFLHTMGNYAFGNVIASIEGLRELTSFDTTKENELKEAWTKNKTKLERMMWEPNLEENHDSIESFKSRVVELKSIIDNNFDALKELFTGLLKLFADKSDVVSRSKIRSVWDHLVVSSKFIGLTSVSKYLTAISTNQLVNIDETGKETVTEMNEGEAKNAVLNLFLYTTAKVLIVSVYNRLYDVMESVCESINVGKSKDVSSFFSNTIASMIVCEDALSNVQDSPVNGNSELMTLFGADKRKIVGTDAISLYVAGLIGMATEENGELSTTKTRLNLARDILFKSSLEFSNIVMDFATNAVKRIIDRLPKQGE